MENHENDRTDLSSDSLQNEERETHLTSERILKPVVSDDLESEVGRQRVISLLNEQAAQRNRFFRKQ